MPKKVLLLNHEYMPISFITERRAIKLLYNGKVEPIAFYEEEDIPNINGHKQLPAILRLGYPIHRNFYSSAYNRHAVFKRDQYCCQYCDRVLSHNQATIDHIIPKFLGGETTFTNCVVACKRCNTRKGNMTLSQAGMELLREPTIPHYNSGIDFYQPKREEWHMDWNHYIRK